MNPWTFMFQAVALSAAPIPYQLVQPKLMELYNGVCSTYGSSIDWALQVDGHTDPRPISRAEFPSNWELSSARATSVVKYLISRGVSPRRLVAAGYGEFAPLEEGTSEEVMRRNRRIELKLTNR